MKRCLSLLLLASLLGVGECRTAQAQDDSCSNDGLCWPRLKRNVTSTAVKSFQQLLRARGYATVADGKFGYGTETMVRKFQKARHLKQDGVVGYQTWEALVPPLQKGSRGGAVRLFQTLLNSYGEGVPKVRVDGVYGAATQRAVITFHKVLYEGEPDNPNNSKADEVDWCNLIGGHFDGE